MESQCGEDLLIRNCNKSMAIVENVKRQGNFEWNGNFLWQKSSKFYEG